MGPCIPAGVSCVFMVAPCQVLGVTQAGAHREAVVSGPPPHPPPVSLCSSDPVEAGEVVKVRVDLLPLHVGLNKLVVNFESDKLKSVKGFRNIIIGPP